MRQKDAATAHPCYHQKKKTPTNCLCKPTALTVLYTYEIKSLNESCHATTFYFRSANILMQLDVEMFPVTFKFQS